MAVDAILHQILIHLLLVAEDPRRGVKIHGRSGAMLSPLLFLFDSNHFRAEMVGSREDLGAKIEGRRKKMKDCRIQEDLKN